MTEEIRSTKERVKSYTERRMVQLYAMMLLG